MKRQYSDIRRQFLRENRMCQTECGLRANQIHHMKGRIGDLLIDTRYFFAVCHECHEKIELNPAWAKEKGFSIDRL